MAVISPAEMVFRCHGLEFARARLAHQPGTLCPTAEIVFGVGADERVLVEQNADAFRRLVHSVGEVRHAEGPRDHALWRLHPERWLESLVVQDVSEVDERLDAACLYSQVPAFSASDRAMIDVLTTTRTGRLAVVELKADEDIHLPLQGLDYWSRVAWHHARGEFQRFGYFPERELSSERPLLFLVAPALHVHPATDTLLHYISPEIEWTVVGIDERWRNGVRAVFRKRPRDMELGTIPDPETALDRGRSSRRLCEFTAATGSKRAGGDARCDATNLLSGPNPQQAPHVHQLGHVVCIVIGQQQGFAQDGLTISPGNTGKKISFRLATRSCMAFRSWRNFLMLAFQAVKLGGASLGQ